MPPFYSGREFTQEEVQETYSVANARIRIECINQRIKLYNILKKIPTHLFSYLDDIIHICCLMVKLSIFYYLKVKYFKISTTLCVEYILFI